MILLFWAAAALTAVLIVWSLFAHYRSAKGASQAVANGSTDNPPCCQVAGDTALNLRTEYAGLCSFYGTTMAARFTLLALFLAAVGALLGGSVTELKAVFIAGLACVAWSVDMRNRVILRQITLRGVQIERYWGYTGERAFDPFFSRSVPWRPGLFGEKSEQPDLFKDKTTLFWFREIPVPFSHSRSLDFVFAVVILYALYRSAYPDSPAQPPLASVQINPSSLDLRVSADVRVNGKRVPAIVVVGQKGP